MKIVLLLSFYASVHSQADRPYQVTRESILPEVNRATPANRSELSSCAQKLVIEFFGILIREEQALVTPQILVCTWIIAHLKSVANTLSFKHSVFLFRGWPKEAIIHLHKEGYCRQTLRFHVFEEAINYPISSWVRYRLLIFWLLFSHRVIDDFHVGRMASIFRRGLGRGCRGGVGLSGCESVRRSVGPVTSRPGL